MELSGSAIMGRVSLCIYTSLIICILLQVLGGGILALNPDGEALLAFKSGLNDSGKAMANWRHSDADPCHWTGVTCNSFKRVMSLNLPYRGLRGSLSPSLGNLQELRRLRLHKNNLYGHIPTEIGNCSKLRALYLQSNFLSGPIPIELGEALEIRFLDISRNALTGSIPPSLGNLTSLKHLNLSANFLEGRIPNLGVLSKFPKTSFVGNLDLCGEQIDLICKSEMEAPYPSVGPSENASTKVYVRYVVNGLVLSVMTTLGFSFAVVVLCFWGYFFYNKVGPQNKVPKASMATGGAKLVTFQGDLPYTPQEITRKIEVLDETDVIGSGGFGVVYRMVMDDDAIFAVKRIEKNTKNCRNLFDMELEILGSLKHRNLVNLRGYCTSPSYNFLIYDFLHKGSLDDCLHGRNPSDTPLNWGARLKIALGVARGLAYLHHDCSPRIVHRDVKSSNILLEENLEAHVSDFGLAKILEDNESHVTTIVAGTFGYLAPEYMQCGRATEKADVYSFGVVLLELISGKRPTDISFIEKGLNVVGWVNTLIKENRVRDILDENCAEVPNESMEALLHIAVSCVSASPEERPCMGNVVKMLEDEILPPCTSDFYDSYSD